jgi:ribonuclease E
VNYLKGKQLLIIEKSQLAILYENGKLLELRMEHQVYKLNEIYAGKISSILPSLNAAFIILNKSAKNGFLHLEEIKSLKREVESLRQPTATKKKNILVQIKKEPTSTKGPSLTSELHLTGRYLTIYPLGNSVQSEKERHDEKEKIYTKAIGQLLKPTQKGILVKKQILNTSTAFLLDELKILKIRWKKICQELKTSVTPALLSKKKNFIIKTLEHSYIPNLTYIGIDAKYGTAILEKIIKLFSKTNRILIEYYANSKMLIRQYNVDLLLHNHMIPRININKGAYIIIEKTEALTVVDVNSGSFIKSSNSRATTFWTNYSAATEISNQIKIRNIGGIIIIDFIDSNNQNDQMKLLIHLTKLLKADHIQTTIVQMSELGLVEITRARQGQSIYDAFSIKCTMCNGIGYVTKVLTAEVTKSYELATQLTPSFSNVIKI